MLNHEEFSELVSTVACGLALDSSDDRHALCAAYNAACAAKRKGEPNWLECAGEALEATLNETEEFDAYADENSEANDDL